MSKRRHENCDLSASGEGTSSNPRKAHLEEVAQRVAKEIDASDPLKLLDKLCDRWELSCKVAGVNNTFRQACEAFGVSYEDDIDINSSSMGLREVIDVIDFHEQEAIAVLNAVRQMDPDGTMVKEQRRANAVIEMVYHAKRIVISAFQSRLAVHQLHCEDHVLPKDIDTLLGHWMLRFRYCDMSKATPLQKLLLHLLDTAMEKRYRKSGGHVYEPIIVDGYETHAWRQVCDLKEFVYSSAKKEMQWEQWSDLTASGNNAKLAVEFLTNCKDDQFPFLKKDRTVFAFRNGVYMASEDHFHRFGTSGPLADTVVAAKYFDAEFDAYEDMPSWSDIPTPHIQQIMDYQQWPPEVCKWMFVMQGRLMYNLGAKDEWQVAPFLLGAAASGKSTLSLKVSKEFYEHADVGVMSNNIEKQFGISAFHDKFLVCSPEVKGDLKIDQADLQSMISGESTQVSVKHKTAFTLDKWTVPCIFAGNEVPNFVDNAGSIHRRFLVFAFNKMVTNGDMRLGDKLKTELPAILVKCNRAYLEAVRDHGSKNIWTVLPPYFHNTRNELAQAVNSVEAFLASDGVVKGPDLACPLAEFRKKWRFFAESTGYNINGKVSDKTMFRTPLERNGLSIEKRATCVWRDSEYTNSEFVVGADLAIPREYISTRVDL